jgi:hypothetical protein
VLDEVSLPTSQKANIHGSNLKNLIMRNYLDARFIERGTTIPRIYAFVKCASQETGSGLVILP